MEVDRDRAIGALVGLACGDALGATLEFRPRDSAPVVRDLVGGGPFRLRPGEWTDDTSMALCLADSLVANRGFDARDLLTRFLAWRTDGANSVSGRCFDIGRLTNASLMRFKAEGVLEAGPPDPRQASNGSLMRLAPVAIFAGVDAEESEELAELQSRTTHPATVAHEACRFFARLLTEALTGSSRDDVLRERHWHGSTEIAAIARGAWKSKSRRQISSSGYVVHTLEAALWCTAQSASFEDALVLAANLGDDADTVAAVTGQIAGALWGYSAIPRRWISVLAWHDHLVERAEALQREGSSIRRDKQLLY